MQSGYMSRTDAHPRFIEPIIGVHQAYESRFCLFAQAVTITLPFTHEKSCRSRADKCRMSWVQRICLDISGPVINVINERNSIHKWLFFAIPPPMTGQASVNPQSHEFSKICGTCSAVFRHALRHEPSGLWSGSPEVMNRQKNVSFPD